MGGGGGVGVGVGLLSTMEARDASSNSLSW